MDILVYGAGVIGSVYAARLQEAGHNVSLLARGQRAVSLRTHGIQLEDAFTGRKTTTQVAVVEQLAPTDRYDVVLVTVRLDQLSSVLPILAANRQVPTLLFLLNNPAGMRQFEELDRAARRSWFSSRWWRPQRRCRALLHALRQVPTMLGEADGRDDAAPAPARGCFQTGRLYREAESRYANVAENPRDHGYGHHLSRRDDGERARSLRGHAATWCCWFRPFVKGCWPCERWARP